VVLIGVAPVAAQSLAPPVDIVTRLSSHEWVSMPGSMPGGTPYFAVDSREVLADVKSPGDGYVYAVGTAKVEDLTQQVMEFSGAPILRPVHDTAGFFFLGGTKQAVFLQVTDAMTGAIGLPSSGPNNGIGQIYFYGNLVSGFPTSLANNARGISVWPDQDRYKMRIAICGDTYEGSLPSGSPPNPNASAIHASGFIAVYDGWLNLLWTHQFYGRDPYGDCAITDVSIRVVNDQDVVTWCGASTHGVALNPDLTPDPTSNLTLQPVQWFSAGAVNNGAGQWDGIFGRLVHDYTGTGTTTDVFLSVDGGRGQDALFGIAERDPNRFVVVGASAASGPAGPNVHEMTAFFIVPS